MTQTRVRAICASCDWSGDPSEVVKERTAGTAHRAGYLLDTCPECGGLVYGSNWRMPARPTQPDEEGEDG